MRQGFSGFFLRVSLVVSEISGDPSFNLSHTSSDDRIEHGQRGVAMEWVRGIKEWVLTTKKDVFLHEGCTSYSADIHKLTEMIHRSRKV